MKFEDFKTVDLRKAVRQFIPELRGAGAIGNIGSKEECIAALVNKGVMAVDVEEYLAASAKVDDITPEVAPVTKVTEDEKKPEQPMFDGFEKAETVIEKQEEAKSETVVPAPMVEAMSAAPKVPSVIAPDPAAQVKSEAEKKLELLQELFGGGKKEIDEAAVKTIVAAMLNEYSENLQHTLSEQAAQTAKNVAEIIERMQAKGVKKIEIKLEGGGTKKLGVCHELTETVAKVVSRAGRNAMLVGPAGSGKTTCCEKVAEILGLPFHAMSCGPETFKSDLLGFVDAAGHDHTTEVREAFEKGGLLLLDEMDAAGAGSLTIMNSLLANGYCAFPGVGMVKRHDNFRCICAANTFGRGADRMYVGRNQLDAATLDRFVVIDFEYDEKMERQLACNDEWVSKVQKWRKAAFDMKARIVISPRASIVGASLLADGFTEKEVEQMVVWKGIEKSLVDKIKAMAY